MKLVSFSRATFVLATLTALGWGCGSSQDADPADASASSPDDNSSSSSGGSSSGRAPTDASADQAAPEADASHTEDASVDLEEADASDASVAPEDSGSIEDAGAPDASFDTTGYTCVEGSAAGCQAQFGARWSGSQCCLEPGFPWTCSSGTSGECTFTGGTYEVWTGTQCCMSVQALCVAGTKSFCEGNLLRWTGTECCVPDALQCRPVADFRACTGSNEKFTGSQCCSK